MEANNRFSVGECAMARLVEVELDYINEETLKAIKDVREGVNLRGPFFSVEELMEDSDAED